MHKDSGRKLSYGALALAAGSEVPPKDVPLKDPKDFVLIGKPLKRLDTPDKVNGKAVYGIDATLPNMKFATLKACPVFGGKVARVDDSAAKKIPGVRKIVVHDDFVAVVGDHMWAAKKGLDALVIDWDEGPNAQVSSNDIWRDLRAASEKDGAVAKAVGDIAKGLATGDQLDAAYELPFLAHATMEPLNATVHVTPDLCEIWTGTQVMTRVQSEAAKAAGLPVDKVIVNNHLLGGGFGRKLEPDMAVAAVRIAKQVDGPVKVVWTREEDIQHDVYRPVYRDTIAATLVDGKIVGWKYKVSGSSIMARWFPAGFQNGVDIDGVDSAIDMPYDIPNFHVDYVRAEPPAVPTGFWRGVGPNNNVFAIESFMDELAKKAGKDPVDFRRGLLGKNPRLLAALNLAVEKSGWGQPLPPRVGRGVSAQPSFASFIATVVEAEIDGFGEVKLRRVTCAVDTGIAVNPDTVMAQLEGGLIFGLTAALYGEVTIDKGRVQQSNFNDYRMLRIDQAPKIDIHVIKSGEAPGGIGETGVTAGPPALRNAILAATGVALRRLPIDRSLIAAGEERHEPGRASQSSQALSRSSWSRWWSASGSSAVPARLTSRAVRRWRWPTPRPPIPAAFHRRLRRQAWWSAARILRKRRTAWPATPRRAASHMPVASDSSCRSERCIRPTSPPTKTPASAITAIRIFLTRSIAASATMVRGFIRRCRIRPIPT